MAAPSHRRHAVNGNGLFDGPSKDDELDNDVSPQVPFLAPTMAPSARPTAPMPLTGLTPPASPGDNEGRTVTAGLGGQAPHEHAALAHFLFLFPIFLCLVSILASVFVQSRRHKDLYAYLRDQTSSLGLSPPRSRRAATTNDPASPLRVKLSGGSSGSIRMERRSRIEYVSAVLKTKVLSEEDLYSPKTPFLKERTSSNLFVGDGIEKEDRVHIISFRKSRSGSICTASMDGSCTETARSSSKSRQGSLFTPSEQDENDSGNNRDLFGGFIRKASGSLTNSNSPPNSTGGGYVEVDLLGMNDSIDGTKHGIGDDISHDEDPLELSNFGLDSKSCAICLGEYQPGDEICWSDNSKCHHAFHKACMVDWLISHEDCPCCRVHYLREEEEYDDNDQARNDNGSSWNEIV